MSPRYVLALDEGSTSARAILVDAGGRVVADARRPVTPHYPRPRWVELDPLEIWEAQRASIEAVLAKAGVSTDDVAALGVTTHRETALIWDRETGEPVHNAVMWMSKQTDDIIARWRAEGLDEEIRCRTGLFNDSYFSAGKLAWLLENVPGVRERAERGELVAGTMDTWLVWKLTGGRSHLTDHSEASRTALFSLSTLDWDDKLLELCGIPAPLLAPAVASDADFGDMRPQELGLPGTRAVPIRAVLADAQSAMFGQGCFEKGSAKMTFGTAGVLTANGGQQPSIPDGLTASVGWTAGGVTAFEAEGVVFHCGQTLQWMREKLGVLAPHDEIDQVAGSIGDTGGVYVVPAFAGICAPYWDREARASIVGLTLQSGAAEVVRAGMEAMAYQTRDSVDAFDASGTVIPELKVDGGASRSNVLCQFLADVLGIPVLRPTELERTALGVAQLAGTSAGLWTQDDLADHWVLDRRFEPQMPETQREELYAGWKAAVDTVLSS